MKQPNPRDEGVDDLAPVYREHYEVARSLEGWFDAAGFKSSYLRMYPRRAPGSILPSDYCFDRENKGNQKHPRFLCWDGARCYRFVGLARSETSTETSATSARAATLSLAEDRPADGTLRRPSSHLTPPASGRVTHAAAGDPVGPHSQLWRSIERRLDTGLPSWRSQIAHYAQVAAVEERERGRKWRDVEVFECVVRSVLSNSTDWSRVERVLPELNARFHGFDLLWYGALTESYVDQSLVTWFRGLKAGSMTLAQDLKRLITTAQRLLALIKEHGSLEACLIRMFKRHGGDPKEVALALGGDSGSEKWPGMGVPLAAEFLKNVGFDVAKPDRHVNRALGCFGLVRFGRWQDRTETKPPQATEGELSAVMRAMEGWAQQVGVRVCSLDNAVWLLCARSGLNLSNDELSRLADRANPAPT